MRPPAPTYEDLRQRVRAFNRSSVIVQCTNLNWSLWRHSGGGKTPIGDAHLVRAYGPRIAAIAAADGSEHRAKVANEQTIVDLCRYYLSVEDAIGDDHFVRQEATVLGSALANSRCEPLRLVDERGVQRAVASLTPSRTLRSQWDWRAAQEYEGILRAWELLKRLGSRHDWLLARLATALNVEPRDYLRVGCIIFGGLHDRRSPGRLNIAGSSISAELRDAWNIDHGVVRLVANRMARTCGEYRAWHDETKRLHRYYRKYHPLPFVRTPLIRLDSSFAGMGDEPNNFLCPSPGHFSWHLRTELLAALNELGGHETWLRLREDLGEEVAKLLGEVIAELGCTSIGLDERRFKKEMRADYVLVEEASALIVESKLAIGSNLGRAVETPHDVASMWERIWTGVEQCSATRQLPLWGEDERLAAVTKVAHVVCVDDLLVTQGAAFVGYAIESGLLLRLGIDNVEVVSFQELQDGLLQLGVAGLVAMIVGKWGDQKGGDFFGAHYPADRRVAPLPACLADAEEELFAGRLGLVRAARKSRGNG